MSVDIDVMAQQKLAVAPESLDRDAFIARFGGVYEHSPWIAEALFDQGIDAAIETAADLGAAMAAILDAGTDAQKMALIRAHPDLAGKAAQAGELTAESTSEQASAGIDQCNAEEFARFQRLNAAYLEKFQFPFIMAVKFSHRTEILDAFDIRIKNSVDAEFKTALAQINKIALIRLMDL